MLYDQSKVGVRYQMADPMFYILADDNHFRGSNTSLPSSDYTSRAGIVTLTGYYNISVKGSVGYLCTNGAWIELTDGWQQIGVTTVQSHSQSDSQSLVNRIIRNNKHILQNNLLCARFADKLTSDQRDLISDLQSRLYDRDQALRNGTTSNVQTSYARGYNEWADQLTALVNHEISGTAGVGVVSTTLVIVISAVVVASLSTAAYYAYKYYADQSDQDVKFSDDLTRTLTEELTPEEYEQLMRETNGLVTRTKILSRLGGYGNVVKYALIGAGLYFIYKAVAPTVRSLKTKK